MAKLILKNLIVSFLFILFVLTALGMGFGVMGEMFLMPFTWRFIGIAVLPLTACLSIFDYKEKY